MSSAAAVVACALFMLGRSERSLPPIELVEFPPIEASAQAEAFVRQPYTAIYLVTSSPTFQDAQRSVFKGCSGDLLALKKLASVIAHEAWHVRHGPDERGAYEAQLTALLFLGVQPGSGIYAGVVKSMQATLKKRRYEKPDRVLADKQ
jgi:hypothetical protein